MKTNIKKLLCMLLVCVMVAGMLPMSAFATGTETAAEPKGTENPVIIDYKTSNGSFDRIEFFDAEGNLIEDAKATYDAEAKKIDVKLPNGFDASGKVKAIFKLTQNGEVPFITITTNANGVSWQLAVNNKFTEKEITLSEGKATFKFYYYNTAPAMPINDYETWTLSFEIINNIPAFNSEVETPVTSVIDAGQNYVTDLSDIYTDADGDALTYQVKVDDGAWTAFEGTVYTYTNSVAGKYALQFRAFDGKDYSEDIYTVNLTVNNKATTYDVNVTIPDGYTVKYYIVSRISNGTVTVGDELAVENGVIKVPENVSMITWSADGVGCGTAAVEANANLDIKAVKFTAKTLTDVVDENAAFKVTDANGAVITVGEDGVALLASGSGYTYNTVPSDTYSDVWGEATLTNQTVSEDSVVVQFTLKGAKSVTAPKEADVTVYHQNKNYNGEVLTPQYITENADGTVTYHYSCTGNVGNTSAGGYVYRVTMEGKITKAGYLNAVNNAVVTWSAEDNTPNYRSDSREANYSTKDGYTGHRAGDNVLMTANASGHLILGDSDSKDLGVFRNWSIINTDTENVAIEPDYHFTRVAGDDAVTFTDLGSAYGNNWQRLTKKGEGTAFIEVSFDAIHIVDGYVDGGWGGAYGHMSNYTYNASNPNTTGLIVVQTDGNAASDVTFNIASDRSQLGREWDAEADTYYITEDTGSMTLAPSASSGVQSVAISNDKGATWTTLTADDNGTYTGTVVPGNNIIRVINGNGQTAYQVVRALKLDITVTNMTDSSKGSEFDPGDKVQISISGLLSPVMKMGGIYNPNSVSGTFSGSDGTTYSIEGQSGGWVGGYGFNGGTYYLNNVVIPESGYLTLSGNYMTVSGFSISIGLHRTITMSGVGANGNAATGGCNASVLPVIVLGEARPQLKGESDITISMRRNQWYDIELSDYFVDEDSENITYYIMEDGATEWTELSGSAYAYYPADDGVQFVCFTALDESMTLEDINDETPILVLTADVEVAPSTVEVTFSVSQGTDKFVTTDQGDIMQPQKITVPYFDLALYGLSDYYYNPRCYAAYEPGTIGSGTPGTKDTAEGVVTMLHVYIWATEVFQLGFDPEDAGKGFSYEDNSLSSYFAATQTAGSAFVNLWNGTNMNYYLNMDYPLGCPKTGATCDQLALYNGDVISVHFIESNMVMGSSFATFVADDNQQYDFATDATEATVDKGESITLTAYQSVSDWVNYITSYMPSSNASVVYIDEDNFEGETSRWNALGTTDGNGQIEIDTTSMTAGTYYIAVQGEVNNAASKEREVAIFKLTVNGGEEEIIYGDINGDGDVNSVDAQLIYRKANGKLTIDFTEAQQTAADVNGDGDVNSVDAQLIYRKANGKLEVFPVQKNV